MIGSDPVSEIVLSLNCVIFDPELMTIFPVVAPPMVNVFIFNDWIVPFALSESPFVPADIDAVGVPPATLINANFADVVAAAPNSRSLVVFNGASAPFANCQKLTELVDIHVGVPVPLDWSI